MRDEVIHARVQADVKEQSEKILNVIGISMSQAINLFLKQLTLKKGIPFKLDSEEKDSNELEKLAYIINSVDGREPSLQAKKIIRLYTNGDIDFETAKFAIIRSHQQWKTHMSTRNVSEGKYKTIKGYEVDKYRYRKHEYKE